MKKITPMYHRVVVRRHKDESITPGGLYMPEKSSHEGPDKGEVTAVGEGRIQEDGSLSPLRLKVGATVLIPKYAGVKWREAEEEYVIIGEDEVLAIVG